MVVLAVDSTVQHACTSLEHATLVLKVRAQPSCIIGFPHWFRVFATQSSMHALLLSFLH